MKCCRHQGTYSCMGPHRGSEGLHNTMLISRDRLLGLFLHTLEAESLKLFPNLSSCPVFLGKSAGPRRVQLGFGWNMVLQGQGASLPEKKSVSPLLMIQRPSCCNACALREHCVGTGCALVHLPGNSPKITCQLSASTAKQQSPQDNNQHMRWHMGPRVIRGVPNLAPNTKLGEVQQDANRFVKGGPIAPSKYCDNRHRHGILTAMYTTETSAGSHSIAAQRQAHTNRYLVPGLSFEGGIFKEQQTIFLTHLVLPNLARVFNGHQQTTLLTQEYHGSGLKSLDDGPPR